MDSASKTRDTASETIGPNGCNPSSSSSEQIVASVPSSRVNVDARLPSTTTLPSSNADNKLSQPCGQKRRVDAEPPACKVRRCAPKKSTAVQDALMGSESTESRSGV